MATSSLAEEQVRLALLKQSGLLDSAPHERLDKIIELSAGLFNVPVALVSLVDKNRQWFKSNHGLKHVSETPRDVAFCSHTIQTRDLLVVEDAILDARFATNPLVTEDPKIRFYAGAPLILHSRYPIGTLCLIDFEPRSFDEQSRRRLKSLADTANSLLEREAADRLSSFSRRTREPECQD